MCKDIKVDLNMATMAKLLKLSDTEGLTLSQVVDNLLSQEIGLISCDKVEAQVNCAPKR
jgi:hypothetical protein